MRATERVEYARDLISEVGLGGERLEMHYIGASDAPIWAARVEAFTNKIKALGPNPLNEVRSKGSRT